MKLNAVRGLFALGASLAGVRAFQKPFQDYGLQSPRPVVPGQNYGYNQTLHLSSLSSQTGFIALNNPRFPAHQIRVKKTDFCDPTVNVYTGYLDVDYGAKHMFFYFFESRRDPDNDDVLMWINGGPGCSSSMGLLMELGPCNIDMTNSSSNGSTWNPYGWNNEANVFFLDQPVGVGFSYADFGETVDNTLDAAKNVHAFVTIFFEAFSQFKGRPLHLAGESYGGHYLPIFASEIVDQNSLARDEGLPTLNLASVLIGNGITDISTLYPGRFDVECGTASLDVPFQSINNCVRMRQALPRCQKAVKESCVDIFDSMNCRAAINFCDTEMGTAYHASGRNVYDISKMCLGDQLCYLEIPVISDYLNSPEVRELLGVESPNNFSACANSVGRAFNAYMDRYVTPTQHYVAELLERGVRMLIYAGTYDWQCNWVANKLWIEKLEWSGSDAFTNPENQWKGWTVENETAGTTKSAGPLTFATIAGAGHMMSNAIMIFAWGDMLMSSLRVNTCLMTSLRKHSRWYPGGSPRKLFRVKETQA